MKIFPHPQLCAFGSLFEKKRIIVPFSYQRNYKWKKPFGERGLNDIIKLTTVEFDKVEEIHFVGAVALKRNKK